MARSLSTVRLRPATARIPAVAALLAPVLLGGCDLVVMNPSGDVARQQANLILASTGLMLLIIVPVIVLTIVFAFKYRATNTDAEYDAEWDHSTGLELIIWAAPLLIVIALGALTWVATHTLDPYRPLDRIAPGRPVTAATRPLEVQVVALDWKWLFIYPEQGIATVNQLVLPVDRPVRFRITSSSVMNTFYVPAMAGMIYAMPGMETKLHAVLNRPGRFEGRSANYSGAGFSDMTFWTDAVDTAGFDRWVAQMRGNAGRLDRAAYLRLEKPSEKVPPMAFGGVEGNLFQRAVEMCVNPDQPCMGATMKHDATEPGSHAPINDRPQRPGEAQGAILRQPEDKGTGKHLTQPKGDAPGARDTGNDANRNLTSLDRPARSIAPGTGTLATARS